VGVGVEGGGGGGGGIGQIPKGNGSWNATPHPRRGGPAATWSRAVGPWKFAKGAELALREIISI